MIAQFRAWFDGRSLRERRLVLAMLGLAALTLVWAAIVLPVTDRLASAKERQSAAVILLADTQARIETVRAIDRSRAPALSTPLDSVIRQRANDAGFTLGNVTAPASDRVQISIASARPGALMAWIGGLESDGILVDTLNLSDNGDKTVAAQVSLKARGR